jgi:phage terminase small subunit
LISVDALERARSRHSRSSGRSGGAPSKPPRPPRWLPKDAAAVWRETVRQMLAAGTWADVYATTLATFAVLEAQFRADTTGFSAAKTAQKRLLAADLGLAPATIARVLKVAPPQPRDFDEFDDPRPRRDDPRKRLGMV